MLRLASVLLLVMSAANVQAHLVIKDAWVREAPPRAQTLAMFLNLTNHADHSVVINAASSEHFKKVEVHQTSFDKGMMRMKHIPELKMKAGEVIDFKPGGMHIMLMRPNKIFKAGDQIDIKLHLKSGKKKVVSALVRSKAPSAKPASDGHGHSH